MPATSAHRWPALVLRAFLPGALAGTQVAGLLFFLNPHLPFGSVAVLRGAVWFGSLLGTGSTVLILPLTWGRPGRSARVLPWSLTAVLTAAALGAWVHASYFSFYLPSGINRRLIKAAIGLSLAAVICFYTALLHSLRRRPVGWGGGLVLLFVALTSIYVIMERREAFKPRLGPAPRATTFHGNPRPQLCVVGLEAATLEAVLPLAEQGRLPFFSRLLLEGAHARLTSMRPTRRPTLWTTLATGRYPYEHGIATEKVYSAPFLGPEMKLTLLPKGGFRHWAMLGDGQPMEAKDRRKLALWEILSRLNIRTGVVGWPLTSPPPKDAQVALSEKFFETAAEAEVWPTELAERARLFHTRIDEIDPALVSRFGSNPPKAVLAAFAADRWRQDLSFFLLEQEPAPEAFFVVLPGLREISRLYFGGHAAVQFEGAQDAVSEEGGQLLSAYYTFLDEFLAGLWEHTRAPRLLVVVSVHGVEGEYGWREAWRVLRRRPALRGYFERGPDGVLLFLGEGIRPGQRVGPAELVDLVPTLLYGLGLPLARDHGGAVLTSAFDTTFLARRPLAFLPSYETFAARRP